MRRAEVTQLRVLRSLTRSHVPAVLALRVAVGAGPPVRSRYLLTGRAVALVVIDVRVRRVDRVVVADLGHESSLPGTPGWWPPAGSVAAATDSFRSEIAT